MKRSARLAELRAWREAEVERQEKLLLAGGRKPVNTGAAVTHLAAVTHGPLLTDNPVTHAASSGERVAKWRKAHGDAAKLKHREYMKRWRREREVSP
jgi:hypothetical protein